MKLFFTPSLSLLLALSFALSTAVADTIKFGNGRYTSMNEGHILTHRTAIWLDLDSFTTQCTACTGTPPEQQTCCQDAVRMIYENGLNSKVDVACGGDGLPACPDPAMLPNRSIQSLAKTLRTNCEITSPSPVFESTNDLVSACNFVSCNPSYYPSEGADSLDQTMKDAISAIPEEFNPQLTGIKTIAGVIIGQWAASDTTVAITECLIGEGTSVIEAESATLKLDSAVAYTVGNSDSQLSTPSPTPTSAATRRLGAAQSRRLETGPTTAATSTIFTEVVISCTDFSCDGTTQTDAILNWYTEIQIAMNNNICSSTLPSGGANSQTQDLYVLWSNIQQNLNAAQVRSLVKILYDIDQNPGANFAENVLTASAYLKVIATTMGACDSYLSSTILANTEFFSQLTSAPGNFFANYAIPKLLTPIYAGLRCLSIYDCQTDVGTFSPTGGTFSCTAFGVSSDGFQTARGYTTKTDVREHSYIAMDNYNIKQCMKSDASGGPDFYDAAKMYRFGAFSRKAQDVYRSIRKFMVSSKQTQLNPNLNDAAYYFSTFNLPANLPSAGPNGVLTVTEGVVSPADANFYGDVLTGQALNQEIPLPLDAAGLSPISDDARYEMSFKLMNFLGTNMYVMREMWDVLHDCKVAADENDQSSGSVKAIDEAAMFGMGNFLEDIYTAYNVATNAIDTSSFTYANQPTAATNGNLWCSNMDKYVPITGQTNSPRFNPSNGNRCSSENENLDTFISILKEVQTYMDTAPPRGDSCEDYLVPKLNELQKILNIPMVMGSLYYLHLGNTNTTPNTSAANDLNQEYSAEAFAFLAPLESSMQSCDSVGATRLLNSIRYRFAVNGPPNYPNGNGDIVIVDTAGDNYMSVEDSYEIMYSMLPCLGLSCADIGDNLNCPDCKKCDDVIPAAFPTTLQADATPNEATWLGQYFEPVTDVNEHAKISKDIADIVTNIENGDHDAAETIYAQGKNSNKGGSKRALRSMARKVPSLAEVQFRSQQNAHGQNWADMRIIMLMNKCKTPNLTQEELNDCAALVGINLVFNVVHPYVSHEQVDCMHDCRLDDINGNVDAKIACNEAAAFYTGYNQPFNNPGDVWSQYGKMEYLSATFFDDPLLNSGAAGSNMYAQNLFKQSQDALLEFEPDCDSIADYTWLLDGLMMSNAVRGFWDTWYFVEQADPNKYEYVQTFAYLIYPMLKMCSPNQAAEFNSRIMTTDNFMADPVNDATFVFNAIQDNYLCMGMSNCEMIGPVIQNPNQETAVGVPGFTVLQKVCLSQPNPTTCYMGSDENKLTNSQYAGPNCQVTPEMTDIEYTFSHNVYPHENIDGDLRAMEHFVDASTYIEAQLVYEEGRNSFKEQCYNADSPLDCTTKMRTVQGFATKDDASMDFKWQKNAEAFYQAQCDRYDTDDDLENFNCDALEFDPATYADFFILNAMKGTELVDLDLDGARPEIVTKVAQATTQNYAMREFTLAATRYCETPTTNGNSVGDYPLFSWDEGVVFSTGRMNRYGDTDAEKRANGILLLNTATKRENEFNPNRSTVDYIQEAVNEGKTILEGQEYLPVDSAKCAALEALVEKMQDRFIVPLLQGIEKYAYNVDVVSSAGAKEKGELFAFSVLAVPQIWACDTDAGDFIWDNVWILGEDIMSGGYKAVYGAIESQFDCLGITCADVGNRGQDAPVCNSPEYAAAYKNAMRLGGGGGAGSTLSVSFALSVAVGVAGLIFGLAM